MSRSYKKTPRSGDCKTTGKKFANRKFRRLMSRDFRNNYRYGDYKKNYCQWDICDWEHVGYSFDKYYKHQLDWYAYCVATNNDWVYNFKEHKRENMRMPSRKESYKEWYKYYKMK